jgi:hypothetical protein
MPLWGWILMIAAAGLVGLWRNVNQRRALRRRREELAIEADERRMGEAAS